MSREPESQSPQQEQESPAPGPQRARRRKWFLIAGLVALSLLFVIFLVGLFYIRSGRVNLYVEDELKSALKEYGLRAEIGKFEITWRPGTANVKDVKIYNRQTDQLIAEIDSAQLEFVIREPYALRFRREVVFKQLNLSGVDLWVKIDEKGTTNFQGVHKAPPGAPRRITFDLSSLFTSLTDGKLHVNDRSRDIEGELGGLFAKAERLGGGIAGLQFGSGTGHIRHDGHETDLAGIDLTGRLSESGAEIERFALRSPMADVNMSGRLDDWDALRYKLDVEARVTLDEAARVFSPKNDLRGHAQFKGRVEGERTRYQVSGSLSADQLIAEDLRLRGLRVDKLSLTPRDDSFDLSSQQTLVEAVQTGDASLADVAILRMRAIIKDGRAQIGAERAAAGSVTIGKKDRLVGATLHDLSATVRDGGYELKANLTLGGGTIDKVRLGQTQGQLVATNSTLSLNGFKTALMGGRAAGDLKVELARGGASRLAVNFSDLKAAELFNVVAVKRPPLSGSVTGRAELSWPGTDIRSLSGTINTHLTGETANTIDTIPLTGDIAVKIARGAFNVDRLELATDASTLTAQGYLSPRGDSNLRFSLTSTRAEQLQMLANSFEETQQLIEGYDLRLAGNFKFDGTITGSLGNPTIDGDLNAQSVGVLGDMLGSLSGHLYLSPAEVRFDNGQLATTSGGTARFTYIGPREPTATTGRLDAVLQRIEVHHDLISGEVSGEAHLTGLPAAPQGTGQLKLVNGKIAGQPVEVTQARIDFNGERAVLERIEAQLPQGRLVANGNFDFKSEEFLFQGSAENVALDRLAELLKLKANVTGTANADFQASGSLRDLNRLNVSLTARGENVIINGRPAGKLELTARTTPSGRINVNMLTEISGKPQYFRASIEMRQPGRPAVIETDLENFDIASVLAAFAPELAKTFSGTVTGRLRVAGPTVNERGEFTPAGLHGSLQITDTTLSIAGNRVNIETPVNIAIDGDQVKLEKTRIRGKGANLEVGGTLALRGGAGLDFSLNGTIDLDTINLLNANLAAGGMMTVNLHVGGTIGDPQLAGDLRVDNFSLEGLDSPLTVEKGTGRITFSGNKATIESFTAHANDGTLQLTGKIEFAQLLKPQQWQFNLTATDISTIYRGALATLNANLILTGTPEGQELAGTITIPQAEYTSNLDLADLISGTGGTFDIGSFIGSDLGPGSSRFPTLRLNLRLEARNSLIIRTDQLRTVGSALLNITGTLNNPDLNGRISFEGGTIKFRGHKYEITTGTIDLPGGTSAVPYLTIVAEGDIRGYHVYVGFTGPTNDLDVSLRSEPDLTRSEILSLLTTGRIESSTFGRDTVVNTGLDTATALLSEELISKPIGREAERFLGLSLFQFDPVLRPDENPAARVTIGREITRDLSLTFSTNLSDRQDQTAIVEYDFSNRFSIISTYSQGGSTRRVTDKDNEFTIGIRGRERFALGFKPDLTANNSANNGGINGRATIGPPPGAGAPPERKPLQQVEVVINAPKEIDISESRKRELLPVVREGFSRPLARLGESNLTNYLQEKGYFFAEVNARCEPPDCNGPNLRLVYDVNPGQRYDLQHIRVEGTDELNKKDVEAELQTRQASALGGLPFFKSLPFLGGTARGITSNDRLRRDRETIRRKMVDLGFRSAKVSTRLAVNINSEDLVVIFDIEEGPRSTIEEVVFDGNTIFSDSKLQPLSKIKEGSVFSLTEVRTGAQQIRDFYTDHGYLDAAIETDVEDLDNNRVRLLFHVKEGTQAIVRVIEIEGETKTHEAAISRFFAFSPGDILTPKKIQKTRRYLYQTGAFREVDINIDKLPDIDETARRVTVRVTEAKPLLFAYGLGYSTDEGPRGQIELTNTNIFGLVNQASIRLRGSRREQFIQLNYVDLRPFGNNWPTTISGFYDHNSDLRTFIRRRLVNGKVENNPAGRSFGLNRFAAFIQTERKLDDFTSVRLRYYFENSKLFNLQDIPLIEITRNEQAIRLGMFSIGVTRDTRDSVLNPTKGELMSADYSLATRIFGGNESFNKLFTDYQRYETIPALRKSVLAMATRVGLAAPFNIRSRTGSPILTEADRMLPINERFFSGGATTLRGFRFEEAGPQAVLEARTPDELPTLVPLGGDALFIFNLELRYPITRRLEIVPFYDLGNVFRHVGDISFGGMTNTVGLGLRIRTPLGPIGIDYGYLLDPPSFITASGGFLRPKRGVIHFRFGQSF